MSFLDGYLERWQERKRRQVERNQAYEAARQTHLQRITGGFKIGDQARHVLSERTVLILAPVLKEDHREVRHSFVRQWTEFCGWSCRLPNLSAVVLQSWELCRLGEQEPATTPSDDRVVWESP